MAIQFNIFRPLWAYRGFIWGSVKREFQGKYRNSLLGAAWNVLNPLAMIVVFTVIFSQMMRVRLPGVDSAFSYSIYLCAGSLTWGLFSEITSRGQNTFLENANMLKKLTFPRLCLPVVAVANACLNFVIVFGLFTLFLVLSGNFPGVIYLSMIPVLIILVAFAIGLGVTLGVLNVFFRDVGQFFGIFLQFWFWFTPIVYVSSALPDTVQSWMQWNPMAPLVVAFQCILVWGIWPDWPTLWYPGLFAMMFCVIGVHLFLRHAGDMVDEL
jgi:lipopolysaccharide transport system permease protein